MHKEVLNIREINMSIFKSLFSMGGAVDTLKDAGDKLIFTGEEKFDSFAVLLKLYEPFKIAQRFFMVIVTIPYMLCWAITFVSSYYVDITAQQELLEGRIGDIVYIMSGFYFGGGLLEGFTKAVKGK